MVSPNEWEALSAVRSVATHSKWSEWAGLPGSDQLTATLRARRWGAPDQSRGPAVETHAALAKAEHTLAAAYEQPYVKHAPIGPYVAVADVHSDRVTVWTHSAHPQALRARLANLLGIAPDKVVVRALEHAGQFGRSTFGGDGAEADAAILSQATGKPVRVQWSLQEDFGWSAASPGWVADIRAAWNGKGRVTAVHSSFYSPHMMDPRPSGALLAGMPAGTARPGVFWRRSGPTIALRIAWRRFTRERILAHPHPTADCAVLSCALRVSGSKTSFSSR